MRLVLTFFLIALAGCASHQTDSALTAGRAQDLIIASNKLASDMWEARTITTKDDREIPYALWPDAIRKLHPVSVYEHGYRMVIVLHRSDLQETGMFITPPSDSMSPPFPFVRPLDMTWTFKPLKLSTGAYLPNLYEYYRNEGEPKSPEPNADGTGRSAVAVPAASRQRVGYLR